MPLQEQTVVDHAVQLFAYKNGTFANTAGQLVQGAVGFLPKDPFVGIEPSHHTQGADTAGQEGNAAAKAQQDRYHGERKQGRSGEQPDGGGGEKTKKCKQGQQASAHNFQNACDGFAVGAAIEGGKIPGFHGDGFCLRLPGVSGCGYGTGGGIHRFFYGAAPQIHGFAHRLTDGLIQFLIILRADGIIHKGLDIPADFLPILIVTSHVHSLHIKVFIL